MGLMDEMMTERYGPPNKCPVNKLAELIGGSEGADLIKAVDDNLVPATVIARVLARRNLTLKPEAVNRHRRGECGCGK